MLVYTCFPVFSPFSAHFYPPLHHNGKGSIALALLSTHLAQKATQISVWEWATRPSHLVCNGTNLDCHAPAKASCDSVQPPGVGLEQGLRQTRARNGT